MSLATLLCFGLVLLFSAVHASAQTKDGAEVMPLDEIVVVASKYRSRIRDIAGDVSSLTDTQLQATLATSMADIFRYTPGVSHEVSGSRFGSEGVVIRGVGGNRVAIEIDGVPLSDQFDIGNFSNAGRDFLDPGFIGRVEILRGPASTLYGSSALGGVVAVQTLDPKSLAANGSIGGDFSGFHQSADSSDNVQGRLAWQGDSLGIVLAASHRDGHEREAKGARADYQSFERRTAMLKLAGANRFGHTWQVSSLRMQGDTQSDISSVLGNGRFRSTTALRGDDEHKFSFLSAAYQTSDEPDPAQAIQLRAYSRLSDLVQKSLDERSASTRAALIRREFNYQQRQQGFEFNAHRDIAVGQWSHRLAAGLEWSERETAELRGASSTSLLTAQQTSTVLGEQFPLRDFPLSTTTEQSAYFSNRISNERITLLLGLRFDQTQLKPKADAIFLEDNPSAELVSINESDVSPKLGLVLRLGNQADLYAQYSKGFRAPPFEDANIGLDIPLFNIRAIPNPDLRSESSDGWELGLRWQNSEAAAKLTFFKTDYKDFIATKVRLGLDPASGRLLFQSQNIRSATIEGAEMELSRALHDWIRGLEINFSAYWAKGKNKVNGATLDAVGPAQAVLGLKWHSPTERTDIQLLLRASASWTDRDESAGELFKPAAYRVLDSYFSHQLSESFSLRIGINNVLDKHYWHWSEVRGLAPSDPVVPALAASGRHFSAGLRWNW